MVGPRTARRTTGDVVTTGDDLAETTHESTPERAGAREWTGLALLVLPMLTMASDMTVLFLALPTLSTELAATASQGLWIVHVYGFMVAGCLITMGRLSDRIGPRRLLMIGSGAFAALSVLAAFSVSAEMLIVARTLLGIAGATLMPSLFSLLRSMFRDDSQRRMAIAVIFASFTVGGAIGPLLGGTLLTFFWWGSVFLVNVPPLVLLLVAATFLLPERRAVEPTRLDLRSVALSLLGMLALVYGVQQLTVGQDGGGAAAWWPNLIAISAGLLALVLFVRRQRHLSDPLLDLALVANRRIAAGLLTIVLVGIGAAGLFFLFTQYLQWALGLEPLEAGIWTLAYIVLNVVGALISPGLAARFDSVRVVTGGLVIAAVGALILVVAPGSPGPLLVGISVIGLGQGLAVALVSDWIISGAPEEKSGSAAAIQEVSGELGVAMGIAISGVVSFAAYRSSLSTALPLDLPDSAITDARESIHGGLVTAERFNSAELESIVHAAVAGGLQIYAGVALVLISLTAAAVWALLIRSPRGRRPTDRSAMTEVHTAAHQA